MPEPVYSASTERVYAQLPEHYRTADERRDYPLKRYLSAIADRAGDVEVLLDRLDLDHDLDPPLANRYAPVFTGYTFVGSWNLDAAFAGGARAYTNQGTDSARYTFTALAPGHYDVIVDTESDSNRTKAEVLLDGELVGIIDQRTPNPPNPPGYVRLDQRAGTVYLPAAGDYTLTLRRRPDSAGDTRFISFHGLRLTQLTHPGNTSALVDPLVADDRWLPWLGQLVGVRLPAGLTPAERRDAVRFASAGWRAGTRGAVADAAKSELTGTRYAEVRDHSTAATGGVGTGGEWDLLIITRTSETPSAAAVVAAVTRKGAAPAGVALHHRAYEASWDAIEARFIAAGAPAGSGALWSNIEGRTWTDIEESGL